MQSLSRSLLSSPRSRAPLRATGIASRRSQRGISILDFGIYLGVVVVLIGIIIGLAALVQVRMHTTRTEQELVWLNESTKASFATQSTYGTADVTSYLANSGDSVPSSLKKTVTGTTVTLANKWGGAVSVTGNNTAFNISYAAMPKTVCNRVLPRLATPQWSAVTVGGTAVALPVTPVSADTACTDGVTVVLSGG